MVAICLLSLLFVIKPCHMTVNIGMETFQQTHCLPCYKQWQQVDIDYQRCPPDNVLYPPLYTRLRNRCSIYNAFRLTPYSLFLYSEAIRSTGVQGITPDRASRLIGSISLYCIQRCNVVLIAIISRLQLL